MDANEGGVEIQWVDCWAQKDEAAEQREQRDQREQREPENWRDKTASPAAASGMFGSKNGSFVFRGKWGSGQERSGNSVAMRYCPGGSCRVWLPEFQFGTNYNMKDGRDIYCTSCNRRNREKRAARRARFLEPEEGGEGCFLDSLERFRFEFSTTKARGAGGMNNHGLPSHSVAMGIIEEVICEARLMKGLLVPFEADEVYERLFGARRLVCKRTGAGITPGCFADHHSIDIKQHNGRVDVTCTNTRPPSNE